ncbi:AraC family transcriptional regulator [Ruficoccus amylovorans]|uniref:AraC family transcriptional regulator n=1 Tax=Ruficoccus amylovorans TaxID=1804625 RepID=A0A842HH40_9BACT|nr:AraC family transcriptional regulator [Ruficoccus amylovorans]MBC2595732.1 AraC family transcriptional regulator [Ruficoccus amylovorans]
MATRSKKAFKPLPALCRSIKSLPAPKDYFKSIPGARTPLPENVLLFHRDISHRQWMIHNERKQPSFHYLYVLIISIRGEGRIIVEGNPHIVNPGQCVLVPPYQAHYYSQLPEDGFEWLFITFEIEKLPPNLRGTGIARTVPPQLPSQLETLLRAFRLALSMPERSDILIWQLAILLTTLADEGMEVPAEDRSRSSAEEKLFLRIHTLITENISSHLSTHQIAEHIGVSESHLRALFKKGAGCSLGRFQRNVRLQHAARLLTRHQMNVTEVASACGWDSPYSFSRAFHRYWGRPPKAFHPKSS